MTAQLWLLYSPSSTRPEPSPWFTRSRKDLAQASWLCREEAKPSACAFRIINQAETEQGPLGICFGVCEYNQCWSGQRVTLLTDPFPLTAVFASPMGMLSLQCKVLNSITMLYIYSTKQRKALFMGMQMAGSDYLCHSSVWSTQHTRDTFTSSMHWSRSTIQK